MNRRGFLQGILAGAALATGLARTKLEHGSFTPTWTGLVEGPAPLMFRGAPIWWDKPSTDAVYLVGPEVHKALERVWRECCKPSDPAPSIIWVSDETLAEFGLLDRSS